jgi:hypothetical protein
VFQYGCRQDVLIDKSLQKAASEFCASVFKENKEGSVP